MGLVPYHAFMRGILHCEILELDTLHTKGGGKNKDTVQIKSRSFLFKSVLSFATYVDHCRIANHKLIVVHTKSEPFKAYINRS